MLLYLAHASSNKVEFRLRSVLDTFKQITHGYSFKNQGDGKQR